jgi:pimeloyl-ACP methyl ester carboxylesterase
VVLRHAALHREPHEGRTDGEGRMDAHADAVVAVSAPARWYYRGTAPMRRLHWLVTRPAGRVMGRHVLRTRIHHCDWDPVPLSPVESVPLIAPTPLLIVHGDRDPYFPVDHPRMLADAAAGAAELWLEPGMGHAEHAAGEELLARVASWATSRTTGVTSGRTEHGY